MKICVYCSSAQGLAPALYAAGEEFGLALARRGHTLVYGGYNAGLMESSVSAGYLSPAVAALAPFYTNAEQLLDALEQGENAGD